MTRLERLIGELESEAATTRRHLARLEDAHLDWRPHPKSFTAGGLASHLVGCIEWTGAVFGAATYGPSADENPSGPA